MRANTLFIAPSILNSIFFYLLYMLSLINASDCYKYLTLEMGCLYALYVVRGLMGEIHFLRFYISVLTFLSEHMLLL